MNALKRILIVLVVVALVGFVTGCANTANSFGHALGNLGEAVKQIGEGTGTLIGGVGDDVRDASSKQLDNRSQNSQGQHAPAANGSADRRAIRNDARDLR